MSDPIKPRRWQQLKLYDVLEDRIDDPVTNEIELRANDCCILRRIAELVDYPLG